MVGRVGPRRSASFSLVFLSRSRCSSLRYLLPDGDRFLDPQRALGASVCVAREESGGESEMRMIFRGFFGGLWRVIDGDQRDDAAALDTRWC